MELKNIFGDKILPIVNLVKDETLNKIEEFKENEVFEKVLSDLSEKKGMARGYLIFGLDFIKNKMPIYKKTVPYDEENEKYEFQIIDNNILRVTLFKSKTVNSVTTKIYSSNKNYRYSLVEGSRLIYHFYNPIKKELVFLFSK